MTDTPTRDIDVVVATSVQPGPDGQQWVVLHINTSVSAYAIYLPVDAADRMATNDQLPAMLRESVQIARRANNGLIIATNPLPEP